MYSNGRLQTLYSTCRVSPNKSWKPGLPYLPIVKFLLRRLWMFLKDVQHGVMQRQEEHRRLNFIVKEAAVVQLLQDISYR